MMTIASTPGGKFTMVGIRAPASNMCPRSAEWNLLELGELSRSK